MKTSHRNSGAGKPRRSATLTILIGAGVTLLVVLFGVLYFRPLATHGLEEAAPATTPQPAQPASWPEPRVFLPLALLSQSRATPTPTVTLTPTSTWTPTATPTFTPTPETCPNTRLTKGPNLVLTGVNTEMKLFWQWPDNSTFTLRWGTDTEYTQNSGSMEVSPYNTTDHLYVTTITGLTPGLKYYYEISSGERCAGASFLAPPPDTDTSVKFIAYGDTRTNGDVHNRVAAEVVSLFRSYPKFQTLVIGGGDWVSEDSEEAWTTEWFDPNYDHIALQDSSIADTGVRGNHEGAATYFVRYFPQPFRPGGLYRSFDYGPMHVVLLDQYVDYLEGSAEYEWLKADLAASNKTWKFVVLHMPGWSAGGKYENNLDVQQQLEPLFVQYGVSVVFAGHNHYYARAVVDGIQHLTVGGGGAPLVTPDLTYPNVVTASANYSYAMIAISGNKLDAQVVTDKGATIDTFSITR